jgi:hypothetical protein
MPRFSRPRKGCVSSLALAAAVVFAAGVEAKPKAKAKPKPQPAAQAERDPLTEWELLNGAAIELRQRIDKQPKNDALRQQMADLAIRSAAGAERALAIGDASLFDSYRRQFGEQFFDTRWRIGRMAVQGSAAAEYAAGVLALHGFGEPRSVEAACKRFGAALARGYLGARFRAAECLDKTDPARAGVLLREAAASGHPVAAEIVGRTCLQAAPQDAQCAWDHLTMAAAAGRPSAQSLLAWMYTQGTGGRPPDPARAVRLYQQAARAGDAAAQNNLAELYELGRGVAVDPAQALHWYRKAAEAGFAPGQFNLGRLYAAGAGVPRDYAEARKWLEQAERGGVATARTLLDWMDQNPETK